VYDPAVRFRAAVAAVALWFVGAQALRWNEPLALDQGLFACFTRWVPRGLLPYRDLFDSKPPAFLYSYALARLFPVELPRAIWLFEALWLAGTMWLAFAIGRRVWDRWAGLTAAALLLAAEWAPGWGGWWSRAQADELVALPMLAAALSAWRAIEIEKLALWAGVLTGVAGLFKIPSMAIAGAWPLTWYFTVGAKPAARRVGCMALGLLAPWAITAGWFAAHGAFGDFVYGAFVYHRYNAEFIAPPWGGVLVDFAKTIVVDGALPLACGVLGLATMQRRERAWLAPWIALTMAAVALERQLAGYHYLLAMPGLAIAGGFGVARLARARRAVAAAGILLVLLAGVEGFRWWRAYSGGPERFERGTFSPAAEQEAARFLRDNSASDDRVLVWGLSPGIYALADRRPVGRYPFHKILYTDAPLSRMIPGLAERRAELIQRFDENPPKWVLVGHHDANGFEPETSFSSMTRFDELRQRLLQDYAQTGQVGRFVLFRRK
jgi:hypothetical protein